MDLKERARNMRRNIVKMVYEAQSGHPGGSLSACDIVCYLFLKEMNISEDNVKSYKRDRFVLSKGHASPVLYAALVEKGLLNEKELSGFRQVYSKLQGHPNMNYVAGVDMSTGSLGQGISAAVGMALANKIDASKDRVYCLLGDGECEEGQVYEALMAASHNKLDNLCLILDYNHLQIDGDISTVAGPEPFKEKFEAFGLKVVECDGHDFKELEKAFETAKEEKGRPTIIIAHTIKGKGVSFMENDYGWHGKAPNDEEFAKAMEELGGKA